VWDKCSKPGIFRVGKKMVKNQIKNFGIGTFLLVFFMSFLLELFLGSLVVGGMR